MNDPSPKLFAQFALSFTNDVSNMPRADQQFVVNQIDEMLRSKEISLDVKQAVKAGFFEAIATEAASNSNAQRVTNMFPPASREALLEVGPARGDMDLT